MLGEEIMLVISRRKGQRIVIGNGVEIVVTALSRSMVRIGIAAPPHTPVFRGEVWDSISAANKEAADAAIEGEPVSVHPGARIALRPAAAAPPASEPHTAATTSESALGAELGAEL